MLDTTQTTNATLYARREAAIPRGVGHTHQIFIDRGENAEIWDVEGKIGRASCRERVSSPV